MGGADLGGAVLDGADLAGANVSEDQLSKAGSLADAIIHTPSPPTAPQRLIVMPSSSVPTQVHEDWKAIDTKMNASYGPVDPSCSSCEPLSSGTNCSRYLGTKYIVPQEEWQELFPDANFFLVAIERIVNGMTVRTGYQRDYFIVAVQNGKQYRIDNFDGLLAVSGVPIVEENFERIAKAFALMALADYIEEEILFLSWEEGSWPAHSRLNYNYSLTAWTRIQGLKVGFLFSFHENRLMMAACYTSEYNTGDYVTEPPIDVFRQLSEEIRF